MQKEFLKKMLNCLYTRDCNKSYVSDYSLFGYMADDLKELYWDGYITSSSKTINTDDTFYPFQLVDFNLTLKGLWKRWSMQ